MRAGWEMVRLGAVTTLRGGGTPSKQENAFWDGNIPWISPKDMKSDVIETSIDKITSDAIANSAASLIPCGSMLIVVRSGILARTVPVAMTAKIVAVNQDIKALVPSDNLNGHYLHYYLRSAEPELLTKVSRGATVHRLATDDIRTLEIPLPPLPEQRRIVAILDEAFAGLAVAVANAEKNLANARELFESYLNNIFTHKGEGWEEITISGIAEHCLGKMLDKKKNKGVLRPYLRNQNVRWFGFDLNDVSEMRFQSHEEERYKALKGDVLVCEGGYPGRAAIWNQNEPIYFQKAIHRIRFHNADHGPWFQYYIYSTDATGKLKEYFTGTGIQHFTGQSLGRFRMPIPPNSETKGLVFKFNILLKETQRLEAIYRQKLAALAELKQSILQKAFAGELTIATTSPEFSAKILAFVYYRHTAPKQKKTFGRVKAQKLLHLTESVAGIELGRQPIKDAAGPNDFAHMLKAEEWAREQKFFEFVERPGGYDFKKLSRFDALITKTLVEVKPFREQLKPLVSLLVPMNSRGAEVFATVHAAWNNLILNDAKITDDAILQESRDNWHRDKMDIPKTEFREAIQLIRDNNIIPDGTAKRVTGQETLF